MDTQRYIDALKAGDSPEAIVPLVASEAAREALEQASVSIEDDGWLVPEEGRMAAGWLRSRAEAPLKLGWRVPEHPFEMTNAQTRVFALPHSAAPLAEGDHERRDSDG
jgi:hypothetical protein